MCDKEIIQVPAIIGKGEQQFFVEKELCIAPPCPPVYMVKEIKKWIEVYDMTTIPGKVIFNAYLWKDINYKTVEKACCNFVSGPVFHFTTKIPFGGFVKICPEVKAGDKAELLEAEIEGERDDWQGACCRQGVKVYTKLLEKTVVRLKFKVVRTKEICIKPCKPFDEKKPCEDACKIEGCMNNECVDKGEDGGKCDFKDEFCFPDKFEL